MAAGQAPLPQHPLYCGEDSQGVLYSCQRGFNWPQSTEANLDPVQGRPTPSEEALLFFICSFSLGWAY